MFDWLRILLSRRTRADSFRQSTCQAVTPSIPPEQDEPLPLDALYVEPDDTEDFDRDECKRLIAKIAEGGAKNVEELDNIAVSLEDFFVGNRCKHSIAANVEPSPPYDTAESWYELLKTIRKSDGIQDVVVEISAIEPYEDGRIGMWPYSNTIWIYSTLDRETIASLVAPWNPMRCAMRCLTMLDWI